MVPETHHLLTLLSSPSLRGNTPIPYQAKRRFLSLTPKFSPSACRAIGSAAANLTMAVRRQPGMSASQIEAVTRTALLKSGWNASLNIDEALFASLAFSFDPSYLALQIAMDRRSKFVDALSNMMKSFNNTQQTIVQNMK